MNTTNLSSLSSDGQEESSMRNDETTPQEIAPGIFLSWLYDKRIVAFHVTRVTRDSLDTYIAINKRLLMHWPTDQTYLALHGAAPDVDIPPYLSKRYIELMHLANTLKLTGRDAILIPKDSTAYLMQMMIRKHLPTLACIEPRIYYDRAAAITWLAARL